MRPLIAIGSILMAVQPVAAAEQCREPTPGQYECATKLACGYIKNDNCYVCLCKSEKSPVWPETCIVNNRECPWKSSGSTSPDKP